MELGTHTVVCPSAREENDSWHPRSAMSKVVNPASTYSFIDWVHAATSTCPCPPASCQRPVMSRETTSGLPLFGAMVYVSGRGVIVEMLSEW